MEFKARGFKSYSGELSIATSRNLSIVNTYIYIYTYYTNTLMYYFILL